MLNVRMGQQHYLLKIKEPKSVTNKKKGAKVSFTHFSFHQEPECKVIYTQENSPGKKKNHV